MLITDDPDDRAEELTQPDLQGQLNSMMHLMKGFMTIHAQAFDTQKVEKENQEARENTEREWRRLWEEQEAERKQNRLEDKAEQRRQDKLEAEQRMAAEVRRMELLITDQKTRMEAAEKSLQEWEEQRISAAKEDKKKYAGDRVPTMAPLEKTEDMQRFL